MGAEVVGLGVANIDYLGVVDRYPEVDHKVELGTFSIQGGGPAATAMVTVAALGHDAAFVGKVGDDFLGDFIVASLAEVGVDVAALVREEGAVSPFSFVAVEHGTGRRNAFAASGSASPLRPDEVPLSVLTGARILLLDGHQTQAAIHVAEVAKRRGIKVVLDAGSNRKGMGDLVALCDVLVASERFANEMAPRGELEDSVESLHSLGPPIVVVTLGEEGAIGSTGDAIHTVPALPVDAIDTTGAGDVYHGAFLHAMLEGWDLHRAMRFAGAAASLKCTVLGGRAGIPTLEEIDAALASKSGG